MTTPVTPIVDCEQTHTGLAVTDLHTNEPLGDGVASPHTWGDLRYIQELKQKHGIDYDSHGSYRLVERSR